MARGRPVVVIQVAFVLAHIGAGSHAAFGQTGNNQSIQLGIPGLNILGVVTTDPAAIALSSSGAKVETPAVNVLGDTLAISKTTVAVDNKSVKVETPAVNALGDTLAISKTTVAVDNKSVKVETPVVTVLGDTLVISKSTVAVDGKGLKVETPAVNVLGDTLAITKSTVELNSKGLSATLPSVNVADAIAISSIALAVNDKGATTKLPDIKVGDQSLWSLSSKDIINHVSPVTQAFAGVGSAEAFAPVEQLLNGLAFGNDAPSACASVDASSFGTPPSADVWTWNAFGASRTEHEGYRVSSSDGTSCGSTFSFQTAERSQLPGVLWDASSAFGFKKGTFHMGFSGGATDSDTIVKTSAALRDAGIAQAGSTRMRSYSLGTFSLLTKENWYAGSAFGGAWGQTESQNFVVGSDSDYNTSTFVAAGFVGTIIPLTDAARLDLRGTLSYQRTVGEAHVDSLGLVYGDHVIEAADAILSARLFGVFRQDEMTIRPFIQAGVTHHLTYGNQLEIEGVAFTLEEADTSLFGAAGLDFEISNTLQLSVGVRHDRSPDLESVTGRLGFSLRLN